MNTDSLAQCSSHFCSMVFGSIWNRSFKNYKIPKKKETMCNNKKKTISKVSEFLILSYTQHRKLGNLGKFYLLKFLVVCETQNQKSDLKEKTLSLPCGLRRKNVHFRDFRVFDFALYLKSKTWKPRKILVYFNFLFFLVALSMEKIKTFHWISN